MTNVLHTAANAYARADEALREAHAAQEMVGRLARADSLTAGKVDALISAERKGRATLTVLVKHVQDLTLAVRGLDGMRAKLDSVSELEEGLTELEAREHRRIRRAKWLGKWGRRVGAAVLIGAATTGGAVAFAFLLEALFGIHIPHVEVHP